MDMSRSSRLPDSSSGEHYYEGEQHQPDYKVQTDDSEERKRSSFHTPRTFAPLDGLNIPAAYRDSAQSKRRSSYETFPREESGLSDPYCPPIQEARNWEDAGRSGQSPSVEGVIAEVVAAVKLISERARSQQIKGAPSQSQEATNYPRKFEDQYTREILDRKPLTSRRERLSQDGHESAAPGNNVAQQQAQRISPHELRQRHSATALAKADTTTRNDEHDSDGHGQTGGFKHNQQDARSIKRPDRGVQRAPTILGTEIDPGHAEPGMSERRHLESKEDPSQPEKDQSIGRPDHENAMYSPNADANSPLKSSQENSLIKKSMPIERDSETIINRFDLTSRPKYISVPRTTTPEVEDTEAQSTQNGTPSVATMSLDGPKAHQVISQTPDSSDISKSEGYSMSLTDTESTCDDGSEADDIVHQILDRMESLNLLIRESFPDQFVQFAPKSHRIGNPSTQPRQGDEPEDGNTRRGKGSRDTRGRREDRSSNQQNSNGKKRKIHGNEYVPHGSPDDEEDEEEEDEINESSGVGSSVTPKFACPFYKHNPEDPRLRTSCFGPGYATIHRLKGHIYRTHRLSPQCERCGQEFESQKNLKDHWRLLEGCHRAPVKVRRGVTDDQITILRCRKRTSLTEYEKWFKIWVLIFSDVGYKPDSPYHHNPEMSARNGVSFKQFLNDMQTPEMEQRIRDKLIQAMVPPLENDVLCRLSEISRILPGILVQLEQEISHERAENYSSSYQASLLDTSGADIPSSGLPSNGTEGMLGNTQATQVLYGKSMPQFDTVSPWNHQLQIGRAPRLLSGTRWSDSIEFAMSQTGDEQSMQIEDPIRSSILSDLPHDGAALGHNLQFSTANGEVGVAGLPRTSHLEGSSVSYHRHTPHDSGVEDYFAFSSKGLFEPGLE